MKIALGAFTSSCVRTRLGGSLADGVELAARHYGRRLRSAHPPPVYGEPAIGNDPPVVEVEVTLDPVDLRSLEAEVERAGGDMQELLTHAILVYLADLDRDRGGCGGRTRERRPLGR